MRSMCLLFLVLTLGCDRSSGVTSNVYVGEPAAEIIGERLTPASLMRTIKGTYLVQETRGDGSLGPSDHQLYVRIDIDPATAQQWRDHIKTLPKTEPAHFSRPRYEVSWWPTKSPLKRAMFVGRPSPWRGAMHGWAAISERGDRVYLYSYTR